MRYSIIVPVYNRPDEVDELLDSLTRQNIKDFEVIIVEDGSTKPCADIVEKYRGSLDVHYHQKDNSGPGQTRNYGAERAAGEYLLILDSDVIVPEGYLEAISKELDSNPCDAFGGPDRSHPSFTDVQKAISYSMTAFITTGGIRGGDVKLDKFYPRSFNMGIRKDVYAALGGFSKMRFGEDIDLSIRIFKSGYSCRLFPDAWVYHKRRTDLRKFFRQVHNSGIARINLYKKYPESLKAVHLLPAAFTIGLLMTPILPCLAIPLLLLFIAAVFFEAMFKELSQSSTQKAVKIGALAVAAAFVQLVGYGTGFLRAFWQRCVLGRGEFEAFKKNFYK
ncbi:MAG: glycosyltransferase [Bacteroidales bacterium]|nr:glycosyltransferase [Bacteroidales bacterium]